ncbi:hypothetical protein CYY_004689 [Polysphondylium violaceum]|uniref:ILEI/PANDER domain-containing protein n=1 Tax=Polysphondylium violaceum TaxID=133409 RepID=A0A8J4V4X3_9MYCE|nr:hypothetical protein CYY_004689 [Polysphondylium violaceum]
MSQSITIDSGKIVYDDTIFNFLATNCNVFIFSPNNEPPFICRNFELQNEEVAKELIAFIDSAPIGYLVMANLINAYYMSDNIKIAFASIGSANIFRYNYIDSAYSKLAIIGYKGLSMGSAQESWTPKVSMNLPDPIPPQMQFVDFGVKNLTPFFNINGIEMKLAYGNGLNVVVLNRKLQIISFKSFNILINSATNYWSYQRMINYLEAIDSESIVCILSQNWSYSSSNANLKTLSTYLKNNFRCTYFDKFLANLNYNWVFMGKLNEAPSVEYTSKDSNTARFYPPLDGSNPVDISVSASSSITNEGGCITRVAGIQSGAVNTYGFTMTLVDDVLGVVIAQYDIIVDNNTGLPNQLTIGGAVGLIQNNLAPGTFVVIASATLPDPFTMNSDLINAFKALGACQAHKISTKTSYALIGRKGASQGSVPEMISSNSTVSLYSTFNVVNPMVKPYVEIKAISKGSTSTSGWAYFSINSIQIPYIANKGFNMLTINETSGEIIDIDSFDITISTEVTRMITKLNALPDKKYVALAVKDVGAQNIPSNLLSVLSSVLMVSNLQNKVTDGASYCCISVARNQFSTVESYETTKQTTVFQRLPILKTVYPEAQQYNCVKIDTSANILISSNSYGRLIENMKIYNFKSNGQTNANSNNATTIYDYIYSLSIGDIVMISCTVKISVTETLKRAMEMIGACKIVHAMRQASNAVRYCVIGRKGCGVGNAMEYYNLDIADTGIAESVSIGYNVPIYPSTTNNLQSDPPVLSFGGLAYYGVPQYNQDLNANVPITVDDFNRERGNIVGAIPALNPKISTPQKRKQRYTVTIFAIITGISYDRTIQEIELPLATKYSRLQYVRLSRYLAVRYPDTQDTKYNINIRTLVEIESWRVQNVALPVSNIRPTITNLKLLMVAANLILKKGDVFYFSFAGHSSLPASMVPQLMFLDEDSEYFVVRLGGFQNLIRVGGGVSVSNSYFTCFSAGQILNPDNSLIQFETILNGKLMAMCTCDRNNVSTLIPYVRYVDYLLNLDLTYGEIFQSMFPIDPAHPNAIPQLYDYSNCTNRPFLCQIALPDPDPNSNELISRNTTSMMINPNEIEFKLASLIASIVELNPSFNIRDVNFEKVFKLLHQIDSNNKSKSSSSSTDRFKYLEN